MKNSYLKNMIRISPYVLVFMLFLAGCAQKEQNKSSQPVPPEGRTVTYTRKVSFLTDLGDTISTVRVAVAKTEAQQNEGLMDVRNLPADAGMLFIFKDDQPRSFWMANTPLPLDIIFINSKKVIVRIFRSAQPYSETNLNSGQPAQYVVEVNGGYTVNHNITEGMKVSL